MVKKGPKLDSIITIGFGQHTYITQEHTLDTVPAEACRRSSLRQSSKLAEDISNYLA
jgi:hypothetical protein